MEEVINKILTKLIFIIILGYYVFEIIQMLQGFKSDPDFVSGEALRSIDLDLLTEHCLMMLIPMGIFTFLIGYWKVESTGVTFVLAWLMFAIFSTRAVLLSIGNSVGTEYTVTSLENMSNTMAQAAGAITRIYNFFWGTKVLIAFGIGFSLLMLAWGPLIAISVGIYAVLTALIVRGCVSLLISITEGGHSVGSVIGMVILFFILSLIPTIFIIKNFDTEPRDIPFFEEGFFENSLDMIFDLGDNLVPVIIFGVLVVITVILILLGKMDGLSDVFSLVFQNDLSDAQELNISEMSEESLLNAMQNYCGFCISFILCYFGSIIREAVMEVTTNEEHNNFFVGGIAACVSIILQGFIIPPITEKLAPILAEYDMPYLPDLKDHLGVEDGTFSLKLIVVAILLVLFNVFYLITGLIFIFYRGICAFLYSLASLFLQDLNISGWVFIIIIFLFAEVLQNMVHDAFSGDY